MTRKWAGRLAESPLLRAGKERFQQCQRNWETPLTKADKARTGLYLILRDYADGLFPPKFADRQKAYTGEIEYRFALPGLSGEAVREGEVRKPFWTGTLGRQYLSGFARFLEIVEALGLAPPAKLLELGCGAGWMAEFLALMRFQVVATTISEHEVRDATRRVSSIQARGLTPTLKYVASPMEAVHEAVKSDGPFDAAFVFEALHHAFSWREALASSAACLKPGGWLLICNEPNLLHTFVAYRVAKLSNTHEIGLSRRALIAQLRQAGCGTVRHFAPRWHFFARPHWLAAQKQ
jgi:2-polyprenyl-3-methyl-5-hydroxy-6-metoxy-1,4-benzoquinol methylase